MSQAKDLLNALSADETTTDNVIPEARIVIGDDRVIRVPNSLKRIAVQYDHNIETVTFECPRYWDGYDMSTMAIYINYMRSDGYPDSYPVAGVSVDESDRMYFDWTISRNVSEVAGTLSILVCVKNVDDEGIELNHWNSELNSELYVSKGMESDVHKAENTYPDIIAQILMDVSANANARHTHENKSILDRFYNDNSYLSFDGYPYFRRSGSLAFHTDIPSPMPTSDINNYFIEATDKIRHGYLDEDGVKKLIGLIKTNFVPKEEVPNAATIEGSTLIFQRVDGDMTTNLFSVDLSV